VPYWQQYDKMKIKKFDSKTTVGRVPMMGGDSDGEKFIISVLVDGSGLVLEFEGEEAYLLPTQELIVEILSQRSLAK